MAWRHDDADYANGGMISHWGSDHAVAVVVLLAFAFLWAVRHGFRGLNVPGVGSISVAA